jgi:hypothetical protein
MQVANEAENLTVISGLLIVASAELVRLYLS